MKITHFGIAAALGAALVSGFLTVPAYAQGTTTPPAQAADKASVSASVSAPLSAPVSASAKVSDKTSMCIGCHEIPGYKASFPVIYSVPMIYGQTAKYIESALTAYRKGDRSHPTMRAIAGSLTDKDIADLASFYGSK